MTTTNFTQEIADKEAVKVNRNQNIKNMAKYFYRMSGSQWCIRKHSDQLLLRFPTTQELKYAYGQIVHRLNYKYKDTLIRTPMELVWFNVLRSNRRFDLRRTVWIGNHCYDVFTASLSLKHQGNEKITHGLVFEIDGPIHNGEPKMKKDEYADETLHRLNIFPYRIDNHHKMTAEHILRQTRITDSRERKRIWKKIYLETILSHATPKELNNLFSISDLELSGGA